MKSWYWGRPLVSHRRSCFYQYTALRNAHASGGISTLQIFSKSFHLLMKHEFLVMMNILESGIGSKLPHFVNFSALGLLLVTPNFYAYAKHTKHFKVYSTFFLLLNSFLHCCIVSTQLLSVPFLQTSLSGR